MIRAVEQPTEQKLGARSCGGCEDHRRDESRPVIDAEVVVELHHEDGCDDAELTLRKVEDAVGPVDEYEPDREKPVVEAGYGAFDDYGKRDGHR